MAVRTNKKYFFRDGEFIMKDRYRTNPRASSWDKEKFGEGAAKRRLKQKQFLNWS